MSNGKTYVSCRQSLYRKLRARDKAALEAGNLAFIMAKEIEAAVGCKVYVLNPLQLSLIYGSMKKTDKEDACLLPPGAAGADTGYKPFARVVCVAGNNDDGKE